MAKKFWEITLLFLTLLSSFFRKSRLFLITRIISSHSWNEFFFVSCKKLSKEKTPFNSYCIKLSSEWILAEEQRNSVNWFLLLTYIVILIAITIKTLVLIFVCCFISVVGWTKWCVRKTLCVNFKVRVTCCVGLRRSSFMIKIIQKLWFYVVHVKSWIERGFWQHQSILNWNQATVFP